MTSRSFTEPLVRRITEGKEERIYGFSRRHVFSPEITGNTSIRCCAVSGPPGAQSSAHSHPGDEVVLSLAGENRNSVGGRSLTLQGFQAIAVPPETRHSTRVTGPGGWEGISFYCDQCPCIRQSQGNAAIAQATVKSLQRPAGKPEPGLHRRVLFSPAQGETAFMQISLFYAAGEGCGEVLLPGESVHVPLLGCFTLSWPGGERSLQPGLAAAIPAGFRHRLVLADSSEALLAVCSCSSCSLAGFTAKPD